MENRVKKEFNEPPIHFALNCSLLGCPILKEVLYSGQNIDSELDAAARLNLSRLRYRRPLLSNEGFITHAVREKRIVFYVLLKHHNRRLWCQVPDLPFPP